MADERLQDASAPHRKDVILLLILAAVVWCVHFSTNYHGFWAPDSMEYADVARNIAAGKGITANSIWTLLLEKYQKLPFPSLFRAPLYPLLTSLVFKLTGPVEFASVLVCGLAYVATIIPLYVLISRLFNRTAALLAVLLYVFHSQSLHYSISGLTEPLATLFFMAFLCFFFLREGHGFLFVSGIMLGLMHATSDKAVPCLVVALAFSLLAGAQKRTWRAPALLLGGFLVMVLPFVLYNYVEFGVLPYNKADPTVALIPAPSSAAANLRSIHPVHALAFAVAHPLLLLFKFSSYFDGFARGVLFGGVVSPYITAFFLLGLFLPRPNPAAGRCYAYVLLALLAQIFALSFLYYVESRYLMNFAPALIGFGAGWFISQADRIGSRPAVRYAAIGLLLFLATEPVATGRSLMGQGEFADQYAKGGQSAYLKKLLERHTGPNAVVVTDAPWSVAWHGRRTAILYPATMEELAEINDRIIPVDAVLITTQMKAAFRARFTQVQDAPWQELLDRKPAGFELGTPGHMTYFALAEVCAYPKETAVLFVKKPVVEKGKR